MELKRNSMGRNISKFLSLVLRHKPQVIGLELDEGGWVNVDLLLQKLEEHGKTVTREELEHIVLTNDKKRYVLSDDGMRIKAAQGHSVDVKLELKTAEPPSLLYHGTVTEALPFIRRGGISKMSRHHVHLSKDKETATKVGARRGEPIILEVDSGKMFKDGFKFFVTENGVWLTDEVPFRYVTIPNIDLATLSLEE